MNLNYEESSKRWRDNKVKYGQSFRYRCNYISSNGERCNIPRFESFLLTDSGYKYEGACLYCKEHILIGGYRLERKYQFINTK